MGKLKQKPVVTGVERRRRPRLDVHAPYTAVRVRREGRKNFSMLGHVYDVSTGGIRFELDRPLDHQELVDVKIQLPGTPRDWISATGRIIRFHDDPEEIGPTRMVMRFGGVQSSRARIQIDTYIRQLNEARGEIESSAA